MQFEPSFSFCVFGHRRNPLLLLPHCRPPHPRQNRPAKIILVNWNRKPNSNKRKTRGTVLAQIACNMGSPTGQLK